MYGLQCGCSSTGAQARQGGPRHAGPSPLLSFPYHHELALDAQDVTRMLWLAVRLQQHKVRKPVKAGRGMQAAYLRVPDSLAGKSAAVALETRVIQVGHEPASGCNAICVLICT